MLQLQENTLNRLLNETFPLEVSDLSLFRSCSKQKETYDSDVDVLMIVDAENNKDNIKKVNVFKAKCQYEPLTKYAP